MYPVTLSGLALKSITMSSVESSPVQVAGVARTYDPEDIAEVGRLIVPLQIVCVVVDGKSAVTIVRKVGVPELPLGAAKNVFATSLMSVAVRVPLAVTGLPDTLNIPGRLSPTLVTVPEMVLQPKPVAAVHFKALVLDPQEGIASAVGAAVDPVALPTTVFAASVARPLNGIRGRSAVPID